MPGTANRPTTSAHPFAAVIFDADGTLIDSEVPGLDVIHQVAASQGLHMTRYEAHERFRGIHMADVVAWFANALPQAEMRSSATCRNTSAPAWRPAFAKA